MDRPRRAPTDRETLADYVAHVLFWGPAELTDALRHAGHDRLDRHAAIAWLSGERMPRRHYVRSILAALRNWGCPVSHDELLGLIERQRELWLDGEEQRRASRAIAAAEYLVELVEDRPGRLLYYRARHGAETLTALADRRRKKRTRLKLAKRVA